MKRTLILLLCVAMLLSVTACKKKQEETPAATTTTTGEETELTYAYDPLINRFFTEYIGKYGKDTLDPQSIHRGPGTASTPTEDLTKEYIATIDGLTVTVRNASYTAEPEGEEAYDVYLLRIAIEGGTTVKSRDRMMQVFSLIACAVDSGCTAEMAESAVEQMENLTDTISYNDYFKVSNFINVIHYTPLNEDVGVATRIELQVNNYTPLAEE